MQIIQITQPIQNIQFTQTLPAINTMSTAQLIVIILPNLGSIFSTIIGAT